MFEEFDKFVKENTGKELVELMALPHDEFKKETDKLMKKLEKLEDNHKRVFIQFKELKDGSVETTMNGRIEDVLMALSVGIGKYLKCHKKNISNMSELITTMVKVIMEELK